MVFTLFIEDVHSLVSRIANSFWNRETEYILAVSGAPGSTVVGYYLTFRILVAFRRIMSPPTCVMIVSLVKMLP